MSLLDEIYCLRTNHLRMHSPPLGVDIRLKREPSLKVQDGSKFFGGQTGNAFHFTYPVGQPLLLLCALPPPRPVHLHHPPFLIRPPPPPSIIDSPWPRYPPWAILLVTIIDH